MIDPEREQVFSKFDCLLFSFLIKRDVCSSQNSALQIPLCLAMSHNDQFHIAFPPCLVIPDNIIYTQQMVFERFRYLCPVRFLPLTRSTPAGMAVQKQISPLYKTEYRRIWFKSFFTNFFVQYYLNNYG